MLLNPPEGGVDPATLEVLGRGHSALGLLYETYRTDIEALCGEMAVVRAAMVARGHSADLSDREAEVLYLTVRALRPNVVCEISPCHGYSTSYILAALTDNRHGRLHSFEIQERVGNTPIGDVIRGNLCRRADPDRLELAVGDVRRQRVPDCDLLVIDSCHEAHFAAWYLEHLTRAPRMVFVHDILIFDRAARCVVPKGTFLGVREQYYVLEALALSQQTCVSVAALAEELHGEKAASLPARFAGPERAVLFEGHAPSDQARKLHAAQHRLLQARQQVLDGDRDGARRVVEAMAAGDDPLFARLEALSLLPAMGYRHPMFADVYPDLRIDRAHLSVSQLVSLLDTAQAAANVDELRRSLETARATPVSRAAAECIGSGYRAMAGLRRGAVAGAWARIGRRFGFGARR
jgi:hypothetical protein